MTEGDGGPRAPESFEPTVGLATATVWSGVDVVARQAFQFLFSLVLARLLSPDDFGLMAIVWVFVAGLGQFVDFGFGAALVQAKDVSDDDASSVFVFNVLAAIVVAAVLSSISPLVSSFYARPILQPILVALSIGLVIGTLNSAHNAILSRRMDFRVQAIVNSVSTVVSGGLGVILAWRGVGVWSLVAQSVVFSVCSVGTMWWLVSWRPRWILRRESLGRLVPFGSRILGANVLASLSDGIYPLVIGKVFGSSDLGLFSRANALQSLPVRTFESIAGRVLFSAFSSRADSRENLSSAGRRGLLVLTFGTTPMTVGMILLARPLVEVLYGPKWVGATPYLQILAVSSLLWPFHVTNLAILKGVGRSDLLFRLELIKRALVFVLVAATFKFGVLGLCWSQVLVGVVAVWLNSLFARRLVGYPLVAQARDVATCWLCGAGMAGVILAGRGIEAGGALGSMAARFAAGILVYLGLAVVLRVEALRLTVSALRRAFPGRTGPGPVDGSSSAGR